MFHKVGDPQSASSTSFSSWAENSSVERKYYSFEEAFATALDYFGGDELAANTWVTKYALQDGKGQFLEKSPSEMHWRLAREFARIEANYQNPMSAGEIFALLDRFKYVVPQGSPMSSIGNPYFLQSLGNCFALPPVIDSYGGIMRTDEQLAQLMKRRAGVGVDISGIRPKGLPTTNAAITTDGIGVFMQRYSNTCREVAQNGRRGAEMLTCSVAHPEIRTFMNIKVDRVKVTGANISVRLSDSFMSAVERGQKFTLQWPVDSAEPKVQEQVDAGELWHNLIYNAWDAAEPGILFWDTITRNSLADIYAVRDPRFKTTTTNPCVTGDTRIAVADGRGSVSISQLAEEGKDVPVYCTDVGGRLRVSTMRRPRKTREQVPVFKVTLEGGHTFRTTGNHEMILSNGRTKRVDALLPGDSLWIGQKVLAKFSEIVPNKTTRSQDYVWVRHTGRSQWRSEHRMFWEAHHGQKVPMGHVIHHVDFDAQNNAIGNLRCMTVEAHQTLHAALMVGEKNPIHRILADPERAEEYRAKMSRACSGLANGNSCGLTNDQLLADVAGWIRELDYIPTKAEYLAKAKEMGWPQALTFRKDTFGNIGGLLQQAAASVGVDVRKVSTTNGNNETQLFQYWRGQTDLPLVYVGGEMRVEKSCEQCGNAFQVSVALREQGYCSHVCGIQGAHAKRMSRVRHNQLDAYTGLKFDLGRAPLMDEWIEKCKDSGISYGIRRGLKYGFNSFKELQQVAAGHNHRVVSVVPDGIEDVFNGTVDEHHTFCMIVGEEPVEGFAHKAELMVGSVNCGEIPLGVDSCRLLLLNLMGFVLDPFTPNACMDWERFDVVARQAQRLMDDIVDLELEQISKILKKIDSDPEPEDIKRVERSMWQNYLETARLGRRTGLGITALADMLAALGIVYGSPESVEWVEQVYRRLALAAHHASADLAQERGAFPLYDFGLEAEADCPYLARLWAADPELKIKERVHGRRNIALTTTAPAGSVSLETQTSSGIEPVFMLEYNRRKKINGSDPTAQVDFVDAVGDRWQIFKVAHHGLAQWMKLNPGKPIESSPYWGATANEIDWGRRVEIQAAATRWLSHSISSTINLPKDVSVDVVKNVYFQAWKLGCKGLTVYRDGCRDGVLIKNDSPQQTESFPQHLAPSRPEQLPCEVHRVKIRAAKGEIAHEEWIIFVGLLGDKPYEIFGGTTENVSLPKKVDQGTIIKRALKNGSKYDFQYGEVEDPLVIRDIVKVFDNPDRGWATRMISLSLRQGTPIQYVVEQLQRDKDSDLFDFARVVARVLKKYVPDGAAPGSAQVCSSCGAAGTLKYQEGCLSCTSCGYSKC